MTRPIPENSNEIRHRLCTFAGVEPLVEMISNFSALFNAHNGTAMPYGSSADMAQSRFEIMFFDSLGNFAAGLITGIESLTEDQRRESFNHLQYSEFENYKWAQSIKDLAFSTDFTHEAMKTLACSFLMDYTEIVPFIGNKVDPSHDRIIRNLDHCLQYFDDHTRLMSEEDFRFYFEALSAICKDAFELRGETNSTVWNRFTRGEIHLNVEAMHRESVEKWLRSMSLGDGEAYANPKWTTEINPETIHAVAITLLFNYHQRLPPCSDFFLEKLSTLLPLIPENDQSRAVLLNMMKNQS